MLSTLDRSAERLVAFLSKAGLTSSAQDALNELLDRHLRPLAECVQEMTRQIVETRTQVAAMEMRVRREAENPDNLAVNSAYHLRLLVRS